MIKTSLAVSSTALALLLAASPSIAGTRLSATAGASAGISSNPYGTSVSDATSATFIANLSPQLLITGPTGSTTLSGNVTHTEYARRYDGATDYTIGARTSQQLSGNTSITAGASFGSQFRNALQPIFDPGSGIPNDPDSPIIVDPSAAQSLAERIKTYSGSLGLTTSLSSRDSLSLSASASSVDIPSTSLFARSYDNFGGQVSYMRSISSVTSLGIGVNLGKSNMRGTAIGDSTQVSPNLILQTQLGPRITTRIAAGLTFSDTDLAGGSSKRTTFYGNGSLCYKGDLSSLCADTSRSVGASSAAGTSILTTFGLSYRLKLDTRSDLGARLSYSSAKTLEALGQIKTDFAQAGLTYDRLITQRLSAGVSVSYSKSYNSLAVNRDSFLGSVGIRYRLGDL